MLKHEILLVWIEIATRIASTLLAFHTFLNETLNGGCHA